MFNLLNMKRQYWVNITLIPVVVIGAWLFSGCHPTSRLTVQPVTGELKPSASGFFYSLPRTVVEVKLEVKHEIFIPGPYSAYASQFLGVEGVQMDRREEWNIISESINCFTERDPEHLFYAGFSSGTPTVPEFLSLTKNGLIFSPAAIFSAFTEPPFSNLNVKDTIWYSDLSMDYFYSQKTDTLYKTVLRDSVFVKIPVYKKEEMHKSNEMKAKELANTIIKLRKRRFKLLSGEYNFITEGAALEITVRELGKMEQEYLSLFIGKHYSESHIYKSYIIPALKSEPQVIFRFSKEHGIYPVESKSGLPVTANFTREYINLQPDINITPVENSLYFRIPENARIQLSLNNKNIAEKRITVYQFGRIQVMPVAPINEMRRRRHP
jgi:Domain of unknown function (DUF4831)